MVCAQFNVTTSNNVYILMTLRYQTKINPGDDEHIIVDNTYHVHSVCNIV